MKLFIEMKQLTLDIINGNTSNHSETLLGFGSGFTFGMIGIEIENLLLKILIAIILGFVSGFGGYLFKRFLVFFDDKKHKECNCDNCIKEKLEELSKQIKDNIKK